MHYKFNVYGHHNITGLHKTTLEFTKDKEVSLKGDCIVGVKANFELSKIKGLINKSNNKKISITIKTISKSIAKETIFAEINKNFNNNHEFVIRKTDFVSERTFAIKANKAAFDLKRDLINYLKVKKNKIRIIIENEEK